MDKGKKDHSQIIVITAVIIICGMPSTTTAASNEKCMTLICVHKVGPREWCTPIWQGIKRRSPGEYMLWVAKGHLNDCPSSTPGLSSGEFCFHREHLNANEKPTTWAWQQQKLSCYSEIGCSLILEINYNRIFTKSGSHFGLPKSLGALQTWLTAQGLMIL